MLWTFKRCKEKDEYIALLRKMLRGIVSAHNKRNPILITFTLLLCEHVRLIPKGSVDQDMPPWWDAENDCVSGLRRPVADRLHFYCQGMEVGFFPEESYPSNEGVFAYVAYRGPGHFELIKRFERYGEAPGYHLGTDPPTHFVARTTEKSGELALSGFTLSPLPEHFTPVICDLPFEEHIESKEPDDAQ